MSRPFALVIVAAFVVASLSTADARPQYLKQFVLKYPKLAGKAKMAKCVVCHDPKKKKIRNDYGKAVEKHLPNKNIKVPAVIDTALEEAEKEKNAAGVPFGQIIGAGNLP